MSCVKYCVFTFPLVVTAVQTHGGVQSALRRIHAPTRDEEGTYIRASVASDLDTLSTPSTPNHQVTMMDIFLLGGWVARPSAFYFVRLRWFLVLLCPLGFSLSPCLFPVFFVARVLLRLTEFNLTALCWPYLFQVCLVFPHRLALILH